MCKDKLQKPVDQAGSWNEAEFIKLIEKIDWMGHYLLKASCKALLFWRFAVKVQRSKQVL